jgi:hypothetical protein
MARSFVGAVQVVRSELGEVGCGVLAEGLTKPTGSPRHHVHLIDSDVRERAHLLDERGPAEADQRNLAALDRIRGPRSERERSSSRIGPGVGLVRIETSSSAPSVPNRHRARPRAGQ